MLQNEVKASTDRKYILFFLITATSEPMEKIVASTFNIWRAGRILI
jgi:hypothetical protein